MREYLESGSGHWRQSVRFADGRELHLASGLLRLYTSNVCYEVVAVSGTVALRSLCPAVGILYADGHQELWLVDRSLSCLGDINDPLNLADYRR